MSWIKGTASSYIDLSNQMVAAATGQSLQTVDSIGEGGTGYVVGDILTLSGGTATIAAQVEVLTLSGSAVATVRRVNDGVYTVTPADEVETTGGTGEGCTLNCTFASNGWTAVIDEVRSGSDRDVMLQGTGGGSDEIYIGWRTLYESGAGYYNLELHGMTGYSASLPFKEQPGLSPGIFDGTTAALRAGAYLISSNSSQAYWLSVTPFRIIGIVKIGSAYFPFYLGWGNRFATSGEYPYPMLIAGPSSLFSDTTASVHSGLTDPWRNYLTDGNTRGPSLVFMPDGAWYGVANASVSDSARTALGDRVVLPTGLPTGSGSAGLEDRFVAAGCAFSDIISQTGLSGNASANLYDTEGTHPLLPAIIVFYDPTPQVVMEIDHVFWVSSFGGVTSEDRFIEGAKVYRVFANCARSDPYAFLAVEEG